MRLTVSLFFALATFFLAPLSSLAQSETPVATDPYGILDIWMRAERLNQRCRILNYFEVREIERGINNAKNQTPEGKAAQVAIGSSNFEAELEKVVQMLGVRRKGAELAINAKPCTDQDPDVKAVRSSYIRYYLKALIASQQSQARLTDRAGRQAAGSQLLTFTQSLYKPNYEAIGTVLISELQSEGFDADVAWEALKNPVNDALWQLRLGQKGYTYHPFPSQTGYYRAVKTDGSGAIFPARLSQRTNPKIVDSAGHEIEINQAEGVTHDGRIIILVSKDATDWGPQTLQAQLLVQETSARHGWIGITWRDRTLRFDADVETGVECPTDFCFTFPAAASEAVRARRAEDDGFYNYELVIAAPNAFPLEGKMNEYGRQKYYPPSLPAN